MKVVMRFDKKEKLSPRYVGPYKILKMIDKVKYELRVASRISSSASGLPYLTLEEVFGSSIFCSSIRECGGER